MNQETQQNKMTNEKTRMYISWENILLNSATMIVLMGLFFSVVIGAEGAILAVPYVIVFMLASLALVVGFFRNRRWYLRTKTADMIFILGTIIAISLSLLGVSVFFGNPPIFMFITPIIVLCFCVYLNHRAQKTGLEIEQGQKIEEVSDKKPLILSSRNFILYLIVWIVSFVVYLFLLDGDPAPDFFPHPFMILWGGMFFAGLYVVINNQENVLRRLFGYVVVAVGLIAFLMLLLFPYN